MSAEWKEQEKVFFQLGSVHAFFQDVNSFVITLFKYPKLAIFAVLHICSCLLVKPDTKKLCNCSSLSTNTTTEDFHTFIQDFDVRWDIRGLCTLLLYDMHIHHSLYIYNITEGPEQGIHCQWQETGSWNRAFKLFEPGQVESAKLNRLKNRAHLAWWEFRMCRCVTGACGPSRPLEKENSTHSCIRGVQFHHKLA